MQEEKSINKKVKYTAYFLLTILCILAVTSTFIWWSLKKGIELDHLSISSIEITQLSLRLDQGFIVHLGRLKIMDQGDSKKDFGPETLIPRIKKWGHLIQEISIDRVTVKDQVIGITYRNGSFQVRSNTFTIEATVAYEQDTFLFDLTRLTIKPYDITLSGKASYSRLKESFLFTGGFTSPWTTGKLNITEQGQEVDIQISSDAFTDLVTILRQFQLDQDLLTWLAQNISAESYQLTRLRIQFPLKEWKNIGPENISGTAVATSAAVRFHPDLSPVKSEKINISYQADRLSFALENPTYMDIRLTGSNVYIDPLIEDDSQLVINIQTKTRLDHEIIELLGKYDIDFPVQQESGTTKANLNLVFDLPQFTLKTKGSFSADPGTWIFRDIPVQTKGLAIQLRDNIITILKAEISYKDILSTRVSGSINTASLHAELLNEIAFLNLKVGDTPLLQATDTRIPLQVNYGSKRVLIRSSAYNASIVFTNDSTTINLNDLKKITPLVPLLQKINFSEGKLHVSMQDMNNIEFSGAIDVPNTVLTEKDKPVTKFQFQGTRIPDQTDISVNDDKITASLTDKLTIKLKDYLVSLDTNTFKDKETAPDLPVPVEITGPALNLQIKEFLISAQEFQFNSDGSDISLQAQLAQGHFLFESSDGEISFVGTELSGEIAETFIHFADFSGGTFNVSLKGDMANHKGYFEFNNVLVKDYVLMNNILAFMNAIPALATLSSPGFDENGYRIQQGIVYFELADKLLLIRHLRADGITVNCEAHGWINFNNNSLEIDMELITLKDYSYLISKIPLAGYAILGKDGTISTSLKIKGPLANPSIKTYLARDIVMTPFNIIKRTFEWPFQMFDKLTGPSPEKPKPDYTDSGKDDKTGK